MRDELSKDTVIRALQPDDYPEVIELWKKIPGSASAVQIPKSAYVAFY